MSEYIGETVLNRAIANAGDIGVCDRLLAPSELIFAIGRHRFKGIVRRANASPIRVIPPCYAVENYWAKNGSDEFLICNSFMDGWDEEEFDMLAPVIVSIINFVRFHMVCGDSLKWEPNLYIRIPTGCGVMAEVAVPIKEYFDTALRFGMDLLDRSCVSQSVETTYHINRVFLEGRANLYDNFNKMVLNIKETERG